MQPFFDHDNLTLYCGDLREVLPTLPENSVDFVVTDPPYGYSFMEKDWDHDVPGPEYWRAIARVCKPGALMLAFGGTRTYHRLTCAIEDAGWEIRDCLMWLYGQGFPKAADVGKMIDKAKGAVREVVGTKVGLPGYSLTDNGRTNEIYGDLHNPEAECAITAPATPEAAKWTGWANALKPAVEPVIVAQKPLNGLQPTQLSLRRRIDSLEDQLWQILYARTAASNSEASQGDVSVPEIAALPASLRAVLFDQMGILPFESVMNTSLSIVTSWKSVLDDGCDLTSTSITETATKPTIAWKTLNCWAWEITPGDIIQAAMVAHGSKCDVVPAVQYFNAAAMSIYATRELSALAGVTWPQRTFCRDETGLGLRPDWLPIVLAMKSLDGTLAHNAEKWGVAGMNIDATRIGDNPGYRYNADRNGTTFHGKQGERIKQSAAKKGSAVIESTKGRWPANLLLDEETADLLDAQSGILTSGTGVVRTKAGDGYHGGMGKAGDAQVVYGDSGGASRFFYTGKATKQERGPGNDHATVKPVKLMEYLLKLLSTPDGGVILDPFAGSGSTLLAAQRLGRRCIGVELTEHNCEIVKNRLSI